MQKSQGQNVATRSRSGGQLKGLLVPTSDGRVCNTFQLSILSVSAARQAGAPRDCETMSGQPTQNQGFQPVGLWSNIFPGYYNSNQQPAGSLNPQQQLALQLQLQAQAHTAQVRVTPDTRDCVWRCSPVASSQPFLVHKAPDSARANRLVSTVSKGRMWTSRRKAFSPLQGARSK